MGQLEDYLSKGNELLEQEKYDEALKYFNSAVELDPQHVWAWIFKGNALIDLKRYAEALESYDRAIGLDPKHAPAWVSRGRALSKLGRYEEALESYNKAIEVDPKEIWAWIWRGEILSVLGRYSEAFESCDKAIELNPNQVEAWMSRGDALAELDRSGEALESYGKATELTPEDGVPFLAMGVFQVTQKQLAEALGNLEKSLRLFEAEKDTDGIRVAKSWIQDLEKRIEEQKTKREPPIEVQIIRRIRENLQKSPDEDPFTRIREREESYEKYFMRPRTITPNRNFLMVLRRWNSFTPKIPNRGLEKKGGGYFLVWKGKGVVIDPGFDFMDNFDRVGYSIRDIDAIILTHAHTDHTADLESMLNLLYELAARTGSEHKVDLFMNLGTVNKFIGWVSCLEGIGNIVSLNAGDSIEPKGYEWVLNIKSARHPEIIGEKNAVGLVFELYEGFKKALKLGFTGDTGWSSKIQKQYSGCKLLILHLGSIGQNEFNEKLPLKGKKRLYENHLGLIGTISIVKSLRSKLSVISEFGEELGTDRCQIAQSLDRVFAQDMRCLTGDIGLKIRLPDLFVYCDVCKNYQDYRHMQEMTIRAGEEIKYHCSFHTPQEVVNGLIK